MQKYEQMGKDLGELTQLKNVAYGDSFAKCGEILAILFPDGIKVEQYRDALGVVRVIDKLFRLANRKNAFGESPWRDIAGYGIVAAVADAESVDEDAACADTNDHAMMAQRRDRAPDVKPELKVGARVRIRTRELPLLNAKLMGCDGVVFEKDDSNLYPWRVRVKGFGGIHFAADELEVLP